MNLFVAASPVDRADVAAYRTALDKVAAITVPFIRQPHEQVIWSGDGVLAASFSIHASHVPIQAYVAADERQFLTFNGMPLFGQSPERGASWAEQLLKRHRDGTLNFGSMGGYYNLLLAESTRVTAWNCLSRVEPLYWTQTPECAAIGNRASLVYALAHRTTQIEYDTDALITLCLVGWLVHECVPFKGVHLVPNGTRVELHRGQLTEIPYKPYRYVTPCGDPEQRVQLVGELTEIMVDGLRVFAGFGDELTINLSGGKDSRIMAAMCKAAGVRFRCVTSGQADDREVIVAGEVTRHLQVPHETSRPTPLHAPFEVDLFERVQQHVVQGDGMTSVYDPTYPIRQTPAILLSGHGGECFRGGYDMLRAGSRPVLENRAMVLKFLSDLDLCHGKTLLHPEAIAIQREINEATVDEYVRSGFPWPFFYDYALTKLREGRGVCNLRQAAAFGAFAFSPYLNDCALQIGWRFPLELRKNERLYYEILRRLDPQLAGMRFSDSRWKFEQDGPLPGTEQSEWEARAPLPETPPAQGALSWRLAYDTHLRPIIRDYLLQNRSSRIFDILDYHKLESVLNEEPPSRPGILRPVYGILTAAYLVNNDWMAPLAA
jgi:hypothetical protein